MPFNIDSFKSNIDKFGVIQNNKYEVYVTPPPILTNNTAYSINTERDMQQIMELLKFRTEEVRVPGVGLYSADISRYGVGPTQKYPFSAIFNEITISFVSDRFCNIWQLWHNWLREVYQFTGVETSRRGDSSNVANYKANYKDDYSSDIQILIYDNYGEVQQVLTLIKAFPIAMRENNLNWFETNDLMNITVNITFKEFMIKNTKLESND